MLPVGSHIGRFVVQRLLGSGGMGVVYGVRHSRLETLHALKLLTPRGSPERLVREGRLQAAIDHPNVVPVLEVLDVDGAPALLMPWVVGPSLAQLLDVHRASEAEAVALFAGIVDGVAAAHQSGVVHRDLKPSNVLLEISFGVVRPRVADFSVAKVVGSDLTLDGQVVGTPSHAAPEQRDDSSAVGPAADLWSLGVLFHQLLTGRPPRNGSLDPDVPDRWTPLLRDLLEVDPARRPASCVTIRAALEPVPNVLGIHGRVAGAVQAWLARPSESIAVATTRDSFADLPSSLVSRDRFVGRVNDKCELEGHLERCTLVTLTGFGGVGKTRLAYELVRTSRARWPGGVWTCDLSASRTAEDVAMALARTLGLRLDATDAVGGLGAALAARGRCLVLLDNFEQVVIEAPETVERWMQLAPDARFLVTSREVLGVPGEQVMRLAPLDDIDAVELLVERVRATAPHRRIRPDDPVVARIVERLDRLPLAIELAAARTTVLEPSDLLARLDDRFRLLASRQRSGPARQTTLRAVLDWSWDLLSPVEQRALAQLSVFEGFFTLSAVEAVLSLGAGWALDVLQDLVDRSLVQVRDDGGFGLLVSTRMYAAERLDASGTREAVERRHGAYFAQWGTDAAIDALFVHGSAVRWKERIRALPELVAACRRAVARGEGDVAVLALRASFVVLRHHGPHALGRGLIRLVTHAADDLELDAIQRAQLAITRARGLKLERSHLACLDMLDAAEGLAIRAGSRRIQAETLAIRGGVCHKLGRIDEARVHFAAARRMAREIGAANLEGNATADLALLESSFGRPEDAEAGFRAALAIYARTGHMVSRGRTLANLAAVLWEQGRIDDARSLQSEALAIARDVGNRQTECNVANDIALLEGEQGRLTEALEVLLEVRQVAEGLGNRSTSVMIDMNLGWRMVEHGRFDEGIALQHEALEHAPNDRFRGQIACNLGLTWLERGNLERARASFRHARGLHRSTGSRRSEGLVLVGSGRLHLARRDLEPARSDLEEALALVEAAGGPSPLTGHVHLYLGVVAAMAGDRGAATAHWAITDAWLDGPRYRLEYAKSLAVRARYETVWDPSSSADRLRRAEAMAADQQAAPSGLLGRRISEARSAIVGAHR